MIKKAKAFLWNGMTRVPGLLVLEREKLIFYPDSFGKSRLSWELPLSELLSVKSCLVFGLVRNGLEIKDKKGNTDLFVIEGIEEFQKSLNKLLK